MSKLQEKPSALKRGHPTLQNMNLIFFYFCGSFLPSWIRIRIHWPDWIRIQSGSGSATLVRLNDEIRVETNVTYILTTFFPSERSEPQATVFFVLCAWVMNMYTFGIIFEHLFSCFSSFFICSLLSGFFFVFFSPFFYFSFLCFFPFSLFHSFHFLAKFAVSSFLNWILHFWKIFSPG